MNRPSTRTVRRTAALTAALAATAGIAVASSGGADAAVHRHPIYFITSGTTINGHSSDTAMIHGYLNAYGTDDNSHANYDVAHFGGGTLRVTHYDSQSTFKPYVNPKTCYASFTLSGTFTTGHGTGRFANVHGSGTYTGSGDGFLQKTKSGACDQNSEPKFETFTIKGKGSIH